MAQTLTPGVIVTMVRPTAQGHATSGSRDFDYGVGDDTHNALEQLRTQIAASIRQAASLDDAATSEMRAVYELAAQIAETARISR